MSKTPPNIANELTDDEAEGEISKSERKRQMLYLQDLGEKLAELKSGQWEALALPAYLTDALAETQRIKKREARRRHFQFLGKLMRKLDESDINAIEQLMDDIRQARHQKANQFHQLEAWRDRLLEGGNSEIEAFLNEHPHADRQWLRQTIRTHQSEVKANKPPAAARKLFQYLRSIT